jgi:1-acyl-sn-glycerol-3-phosphate acyltransferase
MNIQPFKTPPRWWSPKLSPTWIGLWRPLRKFALHKIQRLVEIEVRGIENLQSAVSKKQGVLITPNHSGHADPLILYKATEDICLPLYFMASWQVFGKSNFFTRAFLRQHGCFSINREGSDMKAFRFAASILQKSPNPLVVFPEGEVYHINDKVTPFHDGPSAMAITAARKKVRPVVCVPCGIKYEYVDDPTEELIDLMNRLEDRILWRPRPDMSLVDRMHRFAEGVLGLKELEYTGHSQKSALPDRIKALSNFVLSKIEQKYDVTPDESTLKRVKTLRREAISKLEKSSEQSQERQQAQIDLDDLFFVTQLFSYPGDYVSGKPTIERVAETLDKFEEDIMKVPTASIRASRRAIVSFGEPIKVEITKGKKTGINALTEQLEQNVQQLLDGISIG